MIRQLGLDAQSTHPASAPLRSRDFRLLAASEGAWLLGSRFYVIALPWLVLQLAGHPLALGMVMILSGIPRIAFMLVGGALSDRFSARSLMLGANLARAALLAWLAWAALAGQVDLWIVCGFSLAYGLAEAFFFPARSAIVPLLVQRERLQTANSILLGVEQSSGLIGPVLAGLAIASLSGPAQELGGIGTALAADALATLASVGLLWQMSSHKPHAAHRPASSSPDLVASIKEGVAYVWHHGALRTLFLILAAINLFTAGPLSVGLPMLADARLAEGAAALGVLTSALSGGALLGAALAGALPKPEPRRLGMVFVLIVGVSGAGLALLGSTTSTAGGALAALVLGAALSYANVTLVTYVQSYTPPALMGRMMSLAALK